MHTIFLDTFPVYGDWIYLIGLEVQALNFVSQRLSDGSKALHKGVGAKTFLGKWC